MSSLNLKMEGSEGSRVNDETFKILRDYLQPGSSMTMKSAASALLGLLPEDAPFSTDVWVFGEMCLEVAEQIHYSHPSQMKLAALLEYLGRFKQLGYVHSSTGQYFAYQRLGESLLERIQSDVDSEVPSEHANFHAFAANLNERRVTTTDPLWPIWMQREAHETPLEGPQSIRDAHVLAAAQWILWYGQSLFKQVLSPGETPERPESWAPGPLYDGKAALNIHRWHFWRDGFNAVARGEKGGEKGFGEECKNVAAKAAALMVSFEKNMTF